MTQDIAAPGPSRSRQLIELLLFVFVLVPAVVFALFAFRPERMTFAHLAVYTIVLNVVLLGVVLMLLRRNREPLAALGWTSRDAGREAVIGVLLFLPVFIGAGLLETLLRGAGLTGLDELPAVLIPRDVGDYLLALIFLVTVAVAEETVFRGYLLLRLRAVTGSVGAAVVLSSVIFALGHGYQGSAGVVAVGVLGLVYAAIYVWRGSLVAPMVMHFMQNFMGIMLLPLLVAE